MTQTYLMCHSVPVSLCAFFNPSQLFMQGTNLLNHFVWSCFV